MRSPGGGLHVYLPWERVFSELPWKPVLEILEFQSGTPRLIFEFKLADSTIAGPWSWRTNKDGTTGLYRPVQTEIGRAFAPELLVRWALGKREWERPRSRFESVPWEWHDDFEVADFVECFETSYLCEAWDANDDNLLLVAPEECPVCGRDTDPEGYENARACKAKFFFSGVAWGFYCHYCESHRKELLEKAAEEGWELWEGPMYKPKGAWAEEEKEA